MAIETIELGKVLITFKGAWVGGGTYEKLDVVTKNDSSYICILDAPSGTTLDNGTYWRPLSLGAYDFAVSAGYEGNMEQFAADLADVSTKISTSAIVTNLTTTEEGTVLGGIVGVMLDEKKIDKEAIVNNITTTDIDKVLGANTGTLLTTLYNITYSNPLPVGQYYSSSTARDAVPSTLRKNGLELLYETAPGVWYKERFIGSDVANWTAAGNWEVIPVKAHIEDAEEVVATDLNALSERVSALEAAFRNMIISKIQVDSIDVLKDLHYQGRPLFIVSNVAPNIVPDGVPQFWINTATGDFYSAKNTTSAGDWILK
jgi:hypothetical protein